MGDRYIALFCLLLACGTASAPPSNTPDAQQPCSGETTSASSQVVTDAAFDWEASRLDGRTVAQSFTASQSGELHGIDVILRYCDGGDTVPIAIELVDSDGVKLINKTEALHVNHSDCSAGWSPSLSASVAATIHSDQCLPLTAGKSYTLSLSTPGQESVTVGMSYGDRYTDGTMLVDGTPESGADWAFSVTVYEIE